MQKIILFFIFVWFCIGIYIYLYMEKLITIKDGNELENLKSAASIKGVSVKKYIEQLIKDDLHYSTDLCKELLEDNGQPFRAFNDYLHKTIEDLRDKMPYPASTLEILQNFKETIKMMIQFEKEEKNV